MISIRDLQCYFSEGFIRRFRRDINILIISSSLTSKKISCSMKVTRQSSKTLSPILFRDFVFTKTIAENTFSTLVVTMTRSNFLNYSLMSCETQPIGPVGPDRMHDTIAIRCRSFGGTIASAPSLVPYRK